jgi:hypothetical protein
VVLLYLAREEAEVLRRALGLSPGLRDGKADVETLERGDLVSVGLDPVRDAFQVTRPFTRREARPLTFVEGEPTAASMSSDRPSATSVIGSFVAGLRVVNVRPSRPDRKPPSM